KPTERPAGLVPAGLSGFRTEVLIRHENGISDRSHDTISRRGSSSSRRRFGFGEIDGNFNHFNSYREFSSLLPARSFRLILAGKGNLASRADNSSHTDL